MSRKEKRKQKKQKKLNLITFAQKVKRFILRACLWLCVWIMLTAIIAGGLVHLGVIDIPVVSDVVQEIEIMLHLEHKWVEATCIDPKICEKCGGTEGEPLGHSWVPATCVDAQRCSVCDEVGEDAIGHNWVDATCTDPKTCMTCKETDGDAGGHTWIEATYKAPQTCTVCGITTGTKLQIDPVYINELSYQDKYGKVYYHDNKPATYENNQDWRDQDTPGHVPGLVRDAYGNTFTYGIHLDGTGLGPFYITYEIGGEYTTFCGWCVLPDFMVNSEDALSYSKYFEIYCDGELIFISDVMTNGSTSQHFEIDVTNVDTLTIQYAATPGRNALALLCDGMLY